MAFWLMKGARRIWKRGNPVRRALTTWKRAAHLETRKFGGNAVIWWKRGNLLEAR
jgi:hypothetical protein